MKVAVSRLLLLVAVAISHDSQAQFDPVNDGVAYAPRVVQQARYLETARLVQSGYRVNWQGRSFDWHQPRRQLSRSQRTKAPVVQSRRQARYFYFPQYPELWEPGANLPPKQTLVPRPVHRSPFADPFYEERVLLGVLGDSSGFYPPW